MDSVNSFHADNKSKWINFERKTFLYVTFILLTSIEFNSNKKK